MRILIKNGYVLNPADHTEGVLDVLVKDHLIQDIDENIILDSEPDLIIDASGKYVMPGLIDLHVHLREPGGEYKETIKSGAMAAAAGGYTTICPMPNTNPVIDNKEMVDHINQKADKDSVVHIIPVGAVTKGENGLELSDIAQMKQAGAMALSEDGKSVMNSNLYREAMKIAAKEGMVMLAHCEDKDLVNGGVINAGKKASELGMNGIINAVEDVIVARDILIAKETGTKLHLCHCSTKDSVELVELGKKLGVQVTAEVCPHHFALCDEDIPCDDSNYKMNPPLRSKEDVEALKEGLKNGTMDAIATDHAPHGEEEKQKSMREAPFGIVGSETAFALTMTHLVKTGYLTPMQMVEKMSYNPAKILGIPKGNIAKGNVADLTIADPDIEYCVNTDLFYSKGKNTPFAGHKVTGKVLLTMVDGKVVYDILNS